MSYIYSKAFTLRNDRGSLWEEQDVSQVSITSLINAYHNVRVVVTHSAIEGVFNFKLSEIIGLLDNTSLTLEQFLVENGNRTLPTTEGELSIVKKHWSSADAWSLDFDIRDSKHDSHPETEWPSEDKKDLLLTRRTTDYQDLYNHCLVTVNGYLHRTSYSEHGLYVMDGAKSGRLANKTNVGLISFKNIAPIEIVDINRDMLFHPAEEHKSYEYAYLNLGVATIGKTVLLSIGGYLHLLDDSYKVFGDGLVRIDFNNMAMLQRFFDSKNQIDLTSITPTSIRDGEDHFAVSDLLYSEEYIAGLMDLSQTFAVIVDSNDLRTEKHLLESSDLPCIYYAHSKPVFPLFTKRGLLKEYVSRHEDGIWVVSCDGALVPRYQFETGPYREYASVVGHKIPSKPYYNDRGFLLDVYSNALELSV